MSNMKCPVCDRPMKQATYDYDKKDNDDTMYMSIMPCDCVCNFAASKAVWQELIKLMEENKRTRKALVFAKSKLNGIHRLYSKAFYTREDWLQVCMEMVDKANTALDKITALEQKDK